MSSILVTIYHFYNSLKRIFVANEKLLLKYEKCGREYLLETPTGVISRIDGNIVLQIYSEGKRESSIHTYIYT